MTWREAVLRVMRVPPTPEPPPGSPPRIFRAAPNFFTLRLLRWSLTQVLAIGGLLTAISFAHATVPRSVPGWVVGLITVSEILGATALAAEVLFGWMVIRLDFELRWYMLSDRAIRIREGIATVREKTIALANIQNIAVRQGPLQRLLGIADVEVNTAGGGGKSDMESHKGKRSEPMHVAYFRGVDNADEIRDLLREGVRLQRDAGLGDPDEPEADTDVHAAMAELLAEAKRLRNTIPGTRVDARA